MTVYLGIIVNEPFSCRWYNVDICIQGRHENHVMGGVCGLSILRSVPNLNDVVTQFYPNLLMLNKVGGVIPTPHSPDRYVTFLFVPISEYSGYMIFTMPSSAWRRLI